MPGRLVGVSRDALGKQVFRLALQTREQHIRREKATSNICTAQALLANMAAMYAVYHGPKVFFIFHSGLIHLIKGITEIAQRIHHYTRLLVGSLSSFNIQNHSFFDTVTISVSDSAAIAAKANAAQMNFRVIDSHTVAVALDETVDEQILQDILQVFSANLSAPAPSGIPDNLKRTSSFLTHPTFNTYHSETEMLRYIISLQNKVF